MSATQKEIAEVFRRRVRGGLRQDDAGRGRAVHAHLQEDDLRALRRQARACTATSSSSRRRCRRRSLSRATGRAARQPGEGGGGCVKFVLPRRAHTSTRPPRTSGCRSTRSPPTRSPRPTATSSASSCGGYGRRGVPRPATRTWWRRWSRRWSSSTWSWCARTRLRSRRGVGRAYPAVHRLGRPGPPQAGLFLGAWKPKRN